MGIKLMRLCLSHVLLLLILSIFLFIPGILKSDDDNLFLIHLVMVYNLLGFIIVYNKGTPKKNSTSFNQMLSAMGENNNKNTTLCYHHE